MFISEICIAQQNEKNDDLFKQYLREQEIINKSFSDYYSTNYSKLYALNEQGFISIIDSLRKTFTDQLKQFEINNPTFNKLIIQKETKEIQFSFDKLLLEYPYYHGRLTNEKSKSLNKLIEGKIKDNFKEFDNSELLRLDSFKSYIKAFLYQQSQIELKKPTYKKLDNQQLNATLNLIPKYFSNQAVIDYLRFDHLFNHIDNLGIKNIEKIYHNFIASCKDTSYVNKIKELYIQDQKGREDHLIKTYKTVGNFNLDIHLFLPDKLNQNKQRPVIVYFSGGSWSEGKPDWNFYGCQSYANKGWVGVCVEYRIAYRHGTLPFEAVMDAKSAIRWLRQHANEYNIDTNKIVASGNSAGGHLVLAAALADKWNEKTDDLKYSPIPNVLMVTSGVFDLTDDNTGWIRNGLKERNLDESLVKEISPNFLIKKNLPPTLIIHGTNDKNVPFPSAEEFVKKMTREGNSIEFHPLEGAGHFIWYGRYSDQVSELRRKFIEKLGY
jgi:acetyl esterase/lipase